MQGEVGRRQAARRGWSIVMLRYMTFRYSVSAKGKLRRGGVSPPEELPLHKGAKGASHHFKNKASFFDTLSPAPIVTTLLYTNCVENTIAFVVR